MDKSFIIDTFKKSPLAVCLANNHILDYGIYSFTKTLEYLDQKGIKYFGAGQKATNFNNPSILNISNNRIALFGYTCESTNPTYPQNDTDFGVAPLDIDLISNDINRTRDEVDFIVVQLHWGEEEIKYPKIEDTHLAKRIIDIGADLIIGHHAHVIQSCEQYHNKWIFYGIGNFIFPDLNVPCNYDGRVFSDIYKKKQAKRNRRSLIVDINEVFNITFRKIEFDGKSVFFVGNQKLSNHILTKNEYNIYYKNFIRKKKISNFIKSPKIPSLSQLKNFFLST